MPDEELFPKKDLVFNGPVTGKIVGFDLRDCCFSIELSREVMMGRRIGQKVKITFED